MSTAEKRRIGLSAAKRALDLWFSADFQRTPDEIVDYAAVGEIGGERRLIEAKVFVYAGVLLKQAGAAKLGMVTGIPTDTFAGLTLHAERMNSIVFAVFVDARRFKGAVYGERIDVMARSAYVDSDGRRVEIPLRFMKMGVEENFIWPVEWMRWIDKMIPIEATALDALRTAYTKDGEERADQREGEAYEQMVIEHALKLARKQGDIFE